MKQLIIDKEWITGSGVSDKDLYPVKVELIDNQYLFESTGYIGGDQLQSGDTTFTYIQETDVRVNPGFFYIKDREFYAYNEKITQFSRITTSGELQYIDLLELPNGAGTINYSEFLQGNYSNRTDDIFGTPPILVKYYQSGVLEDINVVLDTVISSRNGIEKQLGYRQLSGEIISGDPSNYPDYFSPLSRFAKCPEYWRIDNSLKYDEYAYDYIHNRIILNSGDPSSIYSIEYENLNIPFRCDIELSPLKTAPGDYILAITPEDNIITGAPAVLAIDLSNDLTAGDVINIRVRVEDSIGNIIKNQPIILSIYSDELSISGESYTGPINGSERYPYFFNISGSVYDYIMATDGDRIAMGPADDAINHIINNQYIIDGKYYIPSYGNLAGPDYIPVEWITYNIEECPLRPYLSGDTDMSGYIYAAYIPPAKIMGDMDLKLKIETGQITDSTTEIRLSSNKGNKLLQMHKTEFTEYLKFTTAEYGEVGDDTLYITVPDDALFPTDITPYEASVYIHNLTTTGTPIKVTPSDIIIDNNKLKIRYTSLGGVGFDRSKISVILRYKKRDEINISDGRSVYVI